MYFNFAAKLDPSEISSPQKLIPLKELALTIVVFFFAEPPTWCLPGMTRVTNKL